MAYYYKTGVIVPFIQKFYKQMIVVVAAIFIASMAAMTFNASAAPKTNNVAANAGKVDICHYDEDEDAYFKINISKNAVAKHIENHGDFAPGVPGAAVENMPGYFWSTECEMEFRRSAEITSPVTGAVLPIGVDLNLVANLADKDGDDSVQWAVRKGTCAAGTGTVAGNVDTFSNPYTWDGASFNATVVTTGFEAGDYCFVFNPTETAGDLAIRETQEFSLTFQGPVGANVLAYVIPECDVNATDEDILQVVIDSAPEGSVVCVENGSYNEFTVNKPLTIAGVNYGGAIVAASALNISDLALVSSSDVTITGLSFIGTMNTNASQVAGVRITPLTGNNADNVSITFNSFENLVSTLQSASNKAIQFFVEAGTGSALTNSTIANNVIDGVNALRGAYGIQLVGDTDNVSIEYNTISNVNGLFGAGVAADAKGVVTNTNTAVSRNHIVDGIWMDVSVQVERNVDQSEVSINENNLLKVVNGGGNPFGASAEEVDAENNWWGDNNPADQVAGPVDFTPWAGSAFSTL